MYLYYTNGPQQSYEPCLVTCLFVPDLWWWKIRDIDADHMSCLIITCNKKMNKTPAPFCKSHCVCCPIFSICGIHSWQKENASKLGAGTVAWPLGDLLDHTLPCFIRSHISPYGGDACVDVNEGLGCSRSDDASLHCTTLIHQLLHFFTVFLLGLVQSLFWRRHQKRFGSNLLK